MIKLLLLIIFSWKNWVIRGIFTWVMIAGFCLIIYGGPLALMVTVSIALCKKYLLQNIYTYTYIYFLDFSCPSEMFC